MGTRLARSFPGILNGTPCVWHESLSSAVPRSHKTRQEYSTNFHIYVMTGWFPVDGLKGVCMYVTEESEASL